MNIRRQILKTLFHRIKPGERAKQRKVGRPDMRRHIDCFRAQLQYDFQKIVTVQSENRPPVRMDVSNLFQFCRYPLRILKSREQNETVHFPDLIVFLINRADLTGDHKPGRTLSRHDSVINPILLFQCIEPVFRGL